MVARERPHERGALRELPRTRMVPEWKRTGIKQRVHATLAK